MTAPSLHRSADLQGVAGGHFAPITCATCGCRLRLEVDAAGQPRWYHFGALGGRDARGCRIPCTDLPHDRSGIADAARETDLLVGGGWR